MDEDSKKRMRNGAVAKWALYPKTEHENENAGSAIVLFSVENHNLRFQTHCHIHWAFSVWALAGEAAKPTKET
jgi:hypothetical protein